MSVISRLTLEQELSTARTALEEANRKLLESEAKIERMREVLQMVWRKLSARRPDGTYEASFTSEELGFGPLLSSPPSQSLEESRREWAKEKLDAVVYDLETAAKLIRTTETGQAAHRLDKALAALKELLPASSNNNAAPQPPDCPSA